MSVHRAHTAALQLEERVRHGRVCEAAVGKRRFFRRRHNGFVARLDPPSSHCAAEPPTRSMPARHSRPPPGMFAALLDEEEKKPRHSSPAASKGALNQGAERVVDVPKAPRAPAKAIKVEPEVALPEVFLCGGCKTQASCCCSGTAVDSRR